MSSYLSSCVSRAPDLARVSGGDFSRSSAMAAVDVLHPPERRALSERIAVLLYSPWRGTGRAIFELRRHHDRAEQRGCREIGDSEAVADEVAGGLELGLDSVERRVHLGAAEFDGCGRDVVPGLVEGSKYRERQPHRTARPRAH